MSRLSIDSQVERIKRTFPRMPADIVDRLFRPLLNNGSLEWTSECLTWGLTGTLFDHIFYPYSTMEVAWMDWTFQDITISEETLNETALEDIHAVIREGVPGDGELHEFLASKMRFYCEFVRRHHTIPGGPLVAICIGDKLKVLNGYPRIAAAFMERESGFKVKGWVGRIASREEQRKIITTVVEKVQKKVSEIEKTCKCMHPCCDAVAIGSHSQQERGQLDNVAENQVVYALNRDHLKTLSGVFFRAEDAVPKLSRQAIARATRFPGYCNSHDTSVFRCIEKKELEKDNPEQVMAFHLRGLSYVYARQRHELMFTKLMWEEMEKIVGPLPPNPQMQNWTIYVPADYEMLIKPCFEEGAIGNYKWIWRIIDKNIGVSCSSCVTPLDDALADRLIGDATDYQKGILRRPRHFASLNVVPLKDRTHVVVAWHKDIDVLAMEFTERLASSDLIVFQNALNEAIFDKSEDYVVAPSLWESLSVAERNEFEFATIPEHMRGRMDKIPTLINLSGCNVT